MTSNWPRTILIKLIKSKRWAYDGYKWNFKYIVYDILYVHTHSGVFGFGSGFKFLGRFEIRSEWINMWGFYFIQFQINVSDDYTLYAY